MPTKIEWCDETFNPWWGCERVSPGCAHCYAATFSRRLGMDHLWPRRPSVSNGQEHGFRFFGDAHWAEPLKWARILPAKLGRRPRIFCASMADVFEERDELVEPRERLFDLIVETPELDWLVLTKRPEYARDLFASWWGAALPGSWPLPNLWLGVSIETTRQTYRADVLREIPAAVRFISAEPLLGSLYDGRRDAEDGRIRGGGNGSHDEDAAHLPVLQGGRNDGDALYRASDARRARTVARSGASSDSLAVEPQMAQGDARVARAPLNLTGIDWLIIGGESGHGARPFRLEHARELLNACGYYGGRQIIEQSPTPFPAPFVKQLGANPVEGYGHRGRSIYEGSWESSLPLRLRDGKGGDMDEWPPDLRVREWPSISSQLVLGAS